MKIKYLKYCIFYVLYFFNTNCISAQASIDGDTVICPASFRTNTYEVIDHPYDAISDVNWNLDYPVTHGFLGANPVVLTWSTIDSDDEATLTVIYKGYNENSDGDLIFVAQETLSVTIDILNIHEPIITSASIVELACNETDFTINLASQLSTAIISSVTHPPCFGYTLSGSQLNFTTDNAASGDICVTVYQPDCGTSVTECITVTRACEDDLAFSSPSPILNSYNSVNNYITASDVSTVSFSNLEFKAGKSILLQPGFSGDEVFLAHIGPCSCVPEGETGCFYGLSMQGQGGQGGSNGSSNTTGGSNKSNVNNNQITQQKTEFVSVEAVETTNSTFTIYPNPSQGAFTIHFEAQPSNTTIQIFDVVGRLRKSIPANNSIQTIDASELENGVYIVVVSGQEHLSKEKIIIAK